MICTSGSLFLSLFLFCNRLWFVRSDQRDDRRFAALLHPHDFRGELGSCARDRIGVHLPWHARARSFLLGLVT